MNSTDKTKHLCQNCGNEHWLRPKPEPRNRREGKKVDFICMNCGTRNLRNGSIHIPEGNLDFESHNKPVFLVTAFLLVSVLLLLLVIAGLSVFFSTKIGG